MLSLMMAFFGCHKVIWHLLLDISVIPWAGGMEVWINPNPLNNLQPKA